MKNRTLRLFALVACVLVLWDSLVRFHFVSPILLAPPTEVFTSLFNLSWSGEIGPDLRATLWRAFVGCVSATLVGSALGSVAGAYGPVADVAIVPADFLRAIPATALLPVFMIALGIGNGAIIALTMFPSTWIMFLSALYGVRSASAVRQDVAKAFGLSPVRRFLQVSLPDSLPQLITGFRISISTALHMAIVAEMFTGVSPGLGRRLLDAQLFLRVPEMYALIVLTGLIGYILNVSWVPIERRMVHWVSR